MNCEELPRSSLAQNTKVPRSQGDYITQVSEEIEGRLTKKLSKEFSRTESRTLGAISRLDEIFLSPPIQGHSGSAPETSRNVLGTNHGANEDYSQSEFHPEARVSQSQTAQVSGPDDSYNKIAFTRGFPFVGETSKPCKTYAYNVEAECKMVLEWKLCNSSSVK